jgi:hypothetical protein
MCEGAGRGSCSLAQLLSASNVLGGSGSEGGGGGGVEGGGQAGAGGGLLGGGGAGDAASFKRIVLYMTVEVLMWPDNKSDRIKKRVNAAEEEGQGEGQGGRVNGGGSGRIPYLIAVQRTWGGSETRKGAISTAPPTLLHAQEVPADMLAPRQAPSLMTRSHAVTTHDFVSNLLLI